MGYNRNNFSTYGAFNPYNPQAFYPQPPMPAQNQNISAQQVHSAGFIRVQTEDEARRYPVAPGGSVTFIDENAPYCYTKSVDFSQLDRPTFKKFRLVEETGEPQKQEEQPKEQVNFATVADFETVKTDFKKECADLKREIDNLWESFENLSTKIEIKKSASKKEDK